MLNRRRLRELKAYRFRLYPSAEQEEMLNEQLELCRDLYNAFLLERRYAYGGSRKSLTYNHQQNEIPELKNAFEEYKEIHSQVLQDVARRVDRAYQNFYRRIREKKQGIKKKAGFPRLKGKGQYKSLTYPQSGFRLMNNGHLKLSKIGRVRMFMHRDIEGEIRTLNISRDSTGKWYASFSVKQEIVAFQPEKTGNSIGIDAGLLHLATMSDGNTVEPPQFLKKGEKRIKKAQRKLSRRKKGSNNRRKAKINLSKQHERVKNQREDFAHKLSSQIVKNNDLIAFEDLYVTGMMKNHHLAKGIADASWSTIVQYTTYKAGSAGKSVVMVDPGNTSRECSNCGYGKESMKLSERTFHCDSCGYEIDRDLNAAINIHNRGLEKVGRGTPEVTPVETGVQLSFRMVQPVREAGSPV